MTIQITNSPMLDIVSSSTSYTTPNHASQELDLDPSKEEVITTLFTQMKLSIANQAHLRNEIYQFDKGYHTFQIENYLLYIARNSSEEKLSAGFFNIEKKSYFAKGGGGKIYAIQGGGQDLVLKLSRKLLNIHGDNGEKISLPLLQNSRTELGELVATSIINEQKVVEYITKYRTNFTGLNVEIFGKVTFNHQVGCLNKAFSCDLLSFLHEQKQLSVANRYDLMCQLMQGLHTFHSIGLRHRDIKLENILIKRGTHSEYDVVISDFGNTCKISRFFAQGLPHPDVQTIIRGTTEKYASMNIIRSINKTLNEMKNYPRESTEYLDGIQVINQLLMENDQFALGLCCYMVWTFKVPDFTSFRNNTYFEFDDHLNQEEQIKKLKEMYQLLLATTSYSSRLNHQGNAHYIAKQILHWIGKGLGIIPS